MPEQMFGNSMDHPFTGKSATQSKGPKIPCQMRNNPNLQFTAVVSFPVLNEPVGPDSSLREDRGPLVNYYSVTSEWALTGE
jgi:hypothetical protein